MPHLRSVALVSFGLCLGAAQAAKPKAKSIPIVASSSKQEAPAKPSAAAAPAPADPGKPGETFAELSFNRTLVIEGKVEKPQVTFTLLKEPPPSKEIRFEASFMDNILKLNRENTFKPGETYGRD